jgi:FkbM family methyltransferase
MDKNAQIICFEPFPKNFKSLAKNIALNGLTNVQLEKKAIGDKEGTIDLYYDEEEMNLGMVTTKPLEKGIKEKVTLVSLDSYLKDHPVPRIDLIKIDIEGFEYPALLGMKHTLTTLHPTILIEILDGNDSENQNLKCNEFLTDLGYKKYFIDDHGKLSENEINPNRMNYVFTTQSFADINKVD